MSAPAAKVSKKELNSNHDGADETSGEEQARRGPARAAIFAARPARRPPVGPGGRWAAGPARASAPFLCARGRAGVAPRRRTALRGGGAAACSARAEETPPSSPPSLALLPLPPSREASLYCAPP